MAGHYHVPQGPDDEWKLRSGRRISKDTMIGGLFWLALVVAGLIYNLSR